MAQPAGSPSSRAITASAAGLAPTQPRYGPEQGFLSSAELVARYAGATGRAVDRIGWYVALGYYKLAIITLSRR